MLSRTDRFEPVDLKRRIFRAASAAQRYHGFRRMASRLPVDEHAKSPESSLELRAFDSSQLPHVLLDATGVVTFANERARRLFGLSGDEVGRPIQDLELSYRPVELRSLIEQTAVDRRPVAAERVEWVRGHGSAFIDVHVVPLVSESGTLLGTGITFSDVTAYHNLEDRLRRSQREVETAYEALQSTVEELETTNEQLRSTNEELETMNEELQSTNEELRRRSLELNDVNIFFESVLLSVQVAVIVTDAKLRVLVWNRAAWDLWGLRRDAVEGQHVLNLDIGFPVDRLRDPLRACLSGDSRQETLVAEAMNRRGRTVTCQVICTPLARGDEIHGAVILMEQIALRDRSAVRP